MKFVHATTFTINCFRLDV